MEETAPPPLPPPESSSSENAQMQLELSTPKRPPSDFYKKICPIPDGTQNDRYLKIKEKIKESTQEPEKWFGILLNPKEISFAVSKEMVRLTGPLTGPLMPKFADNLGTEPTQTDVFTNDELSSEGVERCLFWAAQWASVPSETWPWEIAFSQPKAPLGRKGEMVHHEYPPRPFQTETDFDVVLHEKDSIFMFSNDPIEGLGKQGALPHFGTQDWVCTNEFLEMMKAAKLLELHLHTICRATFFALFMSAKNETETDFDDQKIVKIFGVAMSDSEKLDWNTEVGLKRACDKFTWLRSYLANAQKYQETLTQTRHDMDTSHETSHESDEK